MITKPQEFSKIRAFLFPLHNSELKKFIPMALIMLFILLNYTILRNVKDSLVVNAEGQDEGIISFLKLYGTTPAAILFMILYAKLTNVFSREKIFYISIVPFIVFFGLFAFVIYPNSASLHPSQETVLALQASYPFFKWFIAMGATWSYSLFYILAELWGSVMLSLMFWQFANEIIKTDEAKRFYPLFGFVGNIGLVIAGVTVSALSRAGGSIISGVDSYSASIYLLMSIVVVSGLIVIGLYYWMNRNVVPAVEVTVKEKKKKPTLVESFKLVARSKELFCIALLVLCYGVTINYIDVLWKGQVKVLAGGDKNMFQAYMGDFSSTTGFITLVLMILGGNILRKFSWLQAAALVPLTLIATGLIFYGSILWGSSVAAVALAVQVGFWQGAITKASKYSLFDATKEMAYIPLDPEIKTKGKAAVDVAGGRIGKSGGALTLSILQMIFPLASTVSLAPYLAGVSLVMFAIWFVALFQLNKCLFAPKKDASGDEVLIAA
jgi:AAA family ATP:ADP antiporter